MQSGGSYGFGQEFDQNEKPTALGNLNLGIVRAF